MATENTTEQAGMYTPDELAARLSVAPKTIRKWTASRRLPGMVRCGRAIRFDRIAIERAILSGCVLLPDSRRNYRFS